MSRNSTGSGPLKASAVSRRFGWCDQVLWNVHVTSLCVKQTSQPLTILHQSHQKVYTIIGQTFANEEGETVRQTIVVKLVTLAAPPWTYCVGPVDQIKLLTLVLPFGLSFRVTNRSTLRHHP